MSLQRFLPHLIILLAVLAVMSCTDDWLRSEYDMTVKWEGGYEGPLIFGDLSLKDLLEEFDSTGYVFEDSTGFLYAAYSKDTTLTGPDMLEIKDQKFIQVFFRPETDIPGELLEDTVLVQNKGFKFERTGDERLDSVYVKDGQMRIYVRSTIKHMGNLNISSDSIFLNGKKYDTTIVISDATGTFEQTDSIPLAGGKIYLNNSVPDSSSLYIRFEYELISSGEDIRTTEEVQIINSFHNMEFSAAYGTVGLWDSLLINQAELEFDLLEGAFEGTIKLADPQLNIRTDNSIGVPFDIELLDFEAFFKDGSNTPITIDASANPVRIDAPDITMVGQSVSSESTIDSKNSDLHLAATSDLVGFGYSVRAIANPEGIQDNFLLDDSQLDINIEGLIPLHLRMQDVVLADTFNFFDLGSDEDAEFSQENIDSMMVRLETDNSMPLNLGIQVYFVDSAQNWIRLDSLFKDDRDVFLSGVIDADGRVIRATNKVTSVELTRSQIKNIVDADKLLLKAFIDTPENETRDVKFYSGNALKFKLGTRIAVNYTHEPEN